MELQPFDKGTILYQLISNLAWVITFGRSPTLTKLVRSDERSNSHVGSTYTGAGCCDLFYRFFNKATAHTREPILAHNSPNDAVWCNEDPFGDEKCVILKFGVLYPKNTLNIGRNRQLPAKNKISNNEMGRDTRNMSINHDYETGVTLSDSVNKTL